MERRSLLISTAGVLIVAAFVVSAFGEETQSWLRLSSRRGDIEPPNQGTEQTCLVVADFDGNSRLDFVVGERTTSPSVVWYRNTAAGFVRQVIDDSPLKPEAGGVAGDIDRDGDLDLVLGQDASGCTIWWWENPHPDFGRPWVRHTIKKSGANKHHDQTLADFDGDGQPELVSWNQGAKQLLLFEIPPDPKHLDEWPAKTIFSWSGTPECEGFPNTPVDIDGDGIFDIVGGGHWLKHQGNQRFEACPIDPTMRFTQCAAGQLIPGGYAEVVFSPGDADGDAKWYQWDGSRWVGHPLGFVVHGHTCEIGDINLDGNLDVLIGEMGSPGAGDRARIAVWYGDGHGGFQATTISQGQGIHEGRIADLDGDGDLDIILKPYHHNTPLLEILLNPARQAHRSQ